MALDSTGLTIRRAPEVLSDIVESEKQNINPNISTEDDELLGQLNNILAAAIAEQEALAQAVYDNFNVDKAEGKNLDDLAAIVGITRLTATKASGLLFLTGTASTVASTSKEYTNPTTGDRFVSTEAQTIALAEAVKVVFSVNTVADTTLYTVTVDSVGYDYTSDGSATEDEILTGLETALNLDPTNTFTATADLTADTLTLETDETAEMAVSLSANLDVDILTSQQAIEALTAGELIAPSNTVTNIVVSLAGLDSVTNRDSLTSGRGAETDEELRARIKVAQQISGLSTVQAILDVVTNTAGVSEAFIFENDTGVTDSEGRPPNSFEVVVRGGDSDELALLLWQTKAAGIQTHGNITVVITDSNDQPKDINFSRPEFQNIAFRVSYSKYSEELFPSDGEDLIEATVVSEIGNLNIGEDVIPTRLFGPIYTAVDGIDSLLVEVQILAASGDVPDALAWQEDRLPIAFRELAITAATDITVQEV